MTQQQPATTALFNQLFVDGIDGILPSSAKPRPPGQQLARPSAPVRQATTPPPARQATAPTRATPPPKPAIAQQPAVSSKRPRDAPLLNVKEFVRPDEDSLDLPESDESSLSEDDEDALDDAEQEDDSEASEEPQRVRTRPSLETNNKGRAPTQRDRLTNGHELAMTERETVAKKKELELADREHELAKREFDMGQRCARAEAREKELAQRDQAQQQKEHELTTLHEKVVAHHRMMMEQQTLNRAVSDTIDTRLQALEALEAKKAEAPPSFTTPQRIQLQLERAQIESMLPLQLAQELVYVALTQNRHFDYSAYRLPTEGVPHDTITVEVYEPALKRLVCCQTRWSL